MTGWWIADLYQSGQVVILVSWCFWVILSITLHELGHGWAAVWQGDDTPRRLNRLTLNPIVHMGKWSIIAFLVIGIAWGLMPVSPWKFRWRRWGDVLVSAAGPAVNVALALIALTAATLLVRFGDTESTFGNNLLQFFVVGGQLNMVLVMLNLLPIPPLDGSTILAGFSRQYRNFIQQPQAQFAGLVLVMILLVTDAFSFAFSGTMYAALWFVQIVSGMQMEVVG